MRRLGTILFGACLLLLFGQAQAQTFNTSGTSTLSVAVVHEAAISVTDATTGFTNASATFGAPYVGTTNLVYKIRTTKTGGTGSVTVQVTADFAAGGPSVATPATGDAMTYTCTVAAPGTACSGSQTASTTTATSVATFGTDAKSAKAGNSGSVSWTLPNDPQYSTGTYTATVTFTISAA